MSGIKTITETTNDLMKRRELVLQVQYPNKVTPKNDEMINVLSSFLKVDAANILLKRINPVFGKQEAIVEVNVYDNPEVLKATEMIKKKAKKKQEAPKQEAKK